MEANTGKIILYVSLFLLFLIIRLCFIFDTASLCDIEFRTIAIANSSFPFEIIKNSVTQDCFMPLYYLILRPVIMLSKNPLFLHLFNSVIACTNIFFLIKIGKKIINENFGIFLGFVFTINKFFLFYTTLVSPYCLSFLVGTLLINFIIDFLKKPNKKTAKNLLILNCIYIFTDTLGILFVGIELFVLFLFLKRKKSYAKHFQKLFYNTIIGCFTVLPFLLSHYIINLKLLIPSSTQAIGLNLSGLYLFLNEYISPYLSFITLEDQSKSTLGMLYAYFLNPDFKNINSLKILITLFYSSFLPLLFFIIYSFKTSVKNYKIRILLYIAFLNLIVFLIGVIYELTELNPASVLQFFIILLVSFAYEIYLIKDNLIKYIFIFCLVAIQVINPNINIFNVSVEKKYPVNSVIDTFIKDYQISKDDFIIMPYLGSSGKLYYKNLNFFDFDYKMLKKAGKDEIIKHISNKATKTINKNNFKVVLDDFLLEKKQNDFLRKYFVDNCLDKTESGDRVILIVDKLNSKPFSKDTITKYAYEDKYEPRLRKINFKSNNFSKSDTKTLYNAVSSKTFYNFLNILKNSFYITDIVEYIKRDNEYIKQSNSNTNIYKAAISTNSDYLFIVFKRP